ncbi:MAG: hypothetical protein ACLU45_01920 [Dialister invisus]
MDTINADNSVLEGIRTVNKMLTKKKIRIYRGKLPHACQRNAKLRME